MAGVSGGGRRSSVAGLAAVSDGTPGSLRLGEGVGLCGGRLLHPSGWGRLPSPCTWLASSAGLGSSCWLGLGCVGGWVGEGLVSVRPSPEVRHHLLRLPRRTAQWAGPGWEGWWVTDRRGTEAMTDRPTPATASPEGHPLNHSACPLPLANSRSLSWATPGRAPARPGTATLPRLFPPPLPIGPTAYSAAVATRWWEETGRCQPASP